MKALRILLVQPAPFEPGRLGVENVVWMAEPLALEAIAAMVCHQHEVRIFDMRLESDADFNRALLEFRPDLVGTTSMTTDCYQAKAILQTAKSTLGAGCFTIVGGHHPTLAPEDFEDEVVDAICLGEGEDTFSELVVHLSEDRDPRDLGQISGLKFRTRWGTYASTPKRAQNRNLDSIPFPARHLVPKHYRQSYFFGIAQPMASIETSRGCAFDCNFCAIWEFYESKVRFMSVSAICDRLEKIEERFVFFTDDNFLTNKRRLLELCDEIERRKIKKFFGCQGRTDFIAKNPDILKRLRRVGLSMVLSGYENNSDNALIELRKNNTMENNKKAAAILRSLGVASTGIFMLRPEFDEEDFRLFYATINELGVAIPLVTVLTPLPGTELFRKREKELLTKDYRLFDLMHSVLPTKLPRKRFYELYAQWNEATLPSFRRGIWACLVRNPRVFLYNLRGIILERRRSATYRVIVRSAESHLRDEIGIIDSNLIASNFTTCPELQKNQVNSVSEFTLAANESATPVSSNTVGALQ